MTGENSNKDGEDGAAKNPWTLDRRTVLQLGGAGIASFGMLGMSSNVVSATTNCADGPFERAYSGETISLSELSSDETPDTDDTANASLSSSPLNPLSEDERESRRAAVRGQRPPTDAQQADMEVQRPNGDRLRVGAEYDGVNAEGTRGGVPSDSQIATNEEKHIHALNRQVAVFDKESGEQQLKVQLEDIWESVIPEPDGGFVSGSPFVFDPRARYDRNEDRFIIAAVQFQQGIAEDGSVIDREEIEEGADKPGLGEDEDASTAEESTPDPRPPKGYFVVAVSATDDPTGEWHVYRLPPENADGPDNLGLVDYPTLGLDRDAIYLTQNFFPNDGSDVRVSMVTLDKEAMYDGEAITAHHFDNLDNPTDDYLDFTVQPALQPFSGGSDGTYYMVNSVFPKTQETPLASTLTFWEVTDPIDDPSLECFIVEVDPYTSPPNARQPDSDTFIDPVGRRLMNADYNAETGSLWTAHATAIDWSGDGTLVSAIRWYEIDTESRSLVQSGIYGEPGHSYFLPTIGSNDDTTIIAHNVSGPNTFPRMDVAGRTEGFVQNQLEDAVVIEAGKSRYDYGEGMDVMRWGDYNGISVDPQTGHFWTVSQYSPDINIPPEAERRDPYHTRIAEVSFDWWFDHDQ
ncbi:hypothetical protein [Halocatena marina]|nr:hypothetical protein [Halocatena marina]